MPPRSAPSSPRRPARLILAGIVLAVPVAPALGRADDARPADRAAVRAAMASLVKAFEAGDAKALATHWTAEGEYLRDDGAIRGREALEKAFAAAFAASRGRKAEIEPGSVRFLSRDSAIDEGRVTIRSGSAPPVAAHYSALLVREDGRWLLASLHETTDTEGEATKLADLGWLVGDWKSTDRSSGAEIETSYTWTEAKTFLHVRFKIQEKDRTLGGFQVLGKDPATGELRAWTFESQGGIGAAVWVRDGEHWTAEATGTLADGRTMTSTNILRRIDPDTFTWQAIDRRLDDESLPDLPPTKVTRIKPSK